MYDIRNRITHQVLTWCTDYSRAHQLAAGFEQLEVRPDLGAGHYYWATPTPRFNDRHPFDAEAHAALQAELQELVDAYLAGCNRG